MLQEIIVYLILIVTALHLLHQTFMFFIPAKSPKKGYGCSSGSCSNCSLKIDFESIQPELHHTQQSRGKFMRIKRFN